MNEMWDESNPTDMGKTNRTVTGLYRYFRNAELAGEIDEFGFHKREEAKSAVLIQIADLKERNKLDKIMDLKRKHPLTIEDALAIPATDCILLPYRLDARLHEIKHGVDHNGIKLTEDRHKAIRGNLVWLPGKKHREVGWVPNKNGRWEISEHPAQPNKLTFQDGNAFPVYNHLYSMGVDPIGLYSE